MFLLGLANHFAMNLLIMRPTATGPAKWGTTVGLNSAVTYLAALVGTSGFGPLYASYGVAMASYAAMAPTLVAAAVTAWR